MTKYNQYYLSIRLLQLDSCLHMASSYFNCCEIFKHESNFQSQAPTLRQTHFKNKTFASIQSPKSSLRSPNSLKNFNLSVSQSQAYYKERITNFDLSKTRRSGSINPLNIFKSSTQKVTTSEFKNIQQANNVKSPTLKSYKRITFSYESPSKIIPSKERQQNSQPDKQPKNLISIKQTQQSNVSTAEITFVYDKKNQFCSQKQKFSGKHEQFKKEALTPRQKSLKVSTLSIQKLKLGGSKFTVLSQQDPSQFVDSKQLPIHQSTILLNVFNPTKSQFQNWFINPEEENEKSF